MTNPARSALVDEKAIVNAIIGLLATGGSTNHAIHLPAIARAAGIQIDWEDFDRLSSVVPLIARVYPGGAADVNAFHAAGGMGFVIAELLGAGLAHDITTIGDSFADWTTVPEKTETGVEWVPGPAASLDPTILSPVATPFAPRWRHAAGGRQPRPRHLQDQRRRCGALDDRGARAGVQ